MLRVRQKSNKYNLGRSVIRKVVKLVDRARLKRKMAEESRKYPEENFDVNKANELIEKHLLK